MSRLKRRSDLPELLAPAGDFDCLVAAVEAGAVRIMLEVRAGNHPAIALYEAEGFVQVGRRKNYYQAPREDALLMDCIL